MHRFVTTALDIIGAALIVTSVALVYLPAALAVAGAGLLFISWRATVGTGTR